MAAMVAMAGPSGAAIPPKADLTTDMAELVVALTKDDIPTQVEATTSIRKLLSIEVKPPIQEAIDAGVVPRLAR